MSSDDGGGVQSDWNQSAATHKRLDTLFGLLHEHSLRGKYDQCINVLYRVLAEASSVIDQDEYEECKEGIESCKGWQNKVNPSVEEDLLEAEKTIRQALQGHGMMIAERQESHTGRM